MQKVVQQKDIICETASAAIGNGLTRDRLDAVKNKRFCGVNGVPGTRRWMIHIHDRYREPACATARGNGMLLFATVPY
jgi:hypothetical protein